MYLLSRKFEKSNMWSKGQCLKICSNLSAQNEVAMHNADSIKRLFNAKFGQNPSLMVRACGRINLIGEHTDYNDGFVLPGAIDKHLYFAMAENDTAECRFYAADIGASGTADLEHLVKGKDLWLNYLRGILQQFQLSGKTVRGVDVAFGGNLPIGAGVSSSAALECGFAFALNELFDAGLTRLELAKLAQNSSHQFLSIPCGIMDQFASLMGKAGHFILLDCRTLEHRYVSAELLDYQLVLLNSNVHHELASSAYGERVAECRAGVAVLQKYFPDVKSLRDIELPMLDAHRREMGETVYRRCKYVVTEHLRTLQACDHLQHGEIDVLGQLLFETHEGLSQDYEVSCPEIDFLVDLAKSFEGVAGARVMGGGFGGCTINLVEKKAIDKFIHHAKVVYAQQFGIEATDILVNLSDGTNLL